MKRRELIKLGAGVVILGNVAQASSLQQQGRQDIRATAPDWYEKSFYLYHLDHHTQGKAAVGAEADPAVTDRLLALHRPDVIQTHAKGNPGWTTYPSKVGHTPPKLARDVLGMWRDAARKNGYAWSIYYNLGRDGEIQNRKPEWNRVDAQGKPREHALCYHSGVAEGYIFPMIDEIMAGYDPDAFWFDGSCFTVQTCYCAKCRERFERETGLKPPANFKQPGWDEFKEMHRAIYRECVEALCERIHKKNQHCRVAVNWAWGLHMPEAPPAGISHLTGDTGNNVDRLSVEAHWYDAQPLPFDLMTTIYVRTREGVTIPKPRPQIEQEMAIIVANGGRYHAWDNPTPQSGLNEERHEWLGKVVAPFLRARQEFCLSSTRVPAVSLLFTSTHHYAATRNSPVCFPSAAGASPSLIGASDALTRAHLDYELISRERLLRDDIKTQFLIAEDLAAVREDEVAALRRFVEGGGTLLVTGGGFCLKGMESLSGLIPIANEQSTTAWSFRRNAYSLPLQATRPREEETTAVLLWTTLGANQVMPLHARRMIGKGVVLTTVVPVFSKGLEADGPKLAILRNEILAGFLPSAARPLQTDAPETVEIVLRKQGTRTVLHLVNRAPGNRVPAEVPQQKWLITEIPPTPAFNVALRLPAEPSAVSYKPDGPIDFIYSYKDGRLTLSVPPFAIHQMIVIETKS